MEFLVWDHVFNTELANFDVYPDSIERKGYLLKSGTSCVSWFPSDVEFKMDVDHGVKLVDSLPNNVGLFIVSHALKAMLEKLEEVKVEFLPVSILDHHERVVDADYYVANFLDVAACMDAEQSDFVMGKVDKTQVFQFKQLVLNSEKIPPNLPIFRLAEQTKTLLVEKSLAESIASAYGEGINFVSLEDFGKEHRKIDRLALARAMALKSKAP